MKKINYFLVILTLTLLFSCNDDENESASFQGVIDWEITLGGSGEDVARAVTKTSDGGFAILGFTGSNNGNVTEKTTTDNDYWLVKVGKTGNLFWNNAIGGSDDDIGRALVQTTDGGFALTGYSKSDDGDASNNEGQHDNWVVKTNGNGDLQWEKSYGFLGHDHAYSILQTNDGGYFIGGFLDVSASMGEGSDIILDADAPGGPSQVNESSNNYFRHGIGEFWCHKLDAFGNKEWRKYFGGTNNDRIHSVLEANDGGYILAGYSESDDFDIEDPNGSYDFWVVKVDETGQKVWAKNYGGDGIDISYAATNTNDGYVIAGSTTSNNTGDVTNFKGVTDVWVIKIDNAGKLIWQKSLGGSQFDISNAITPGKDGSFFVAGSSKSTDGDVTKNQGENDFWVLQLDASGNLLWESTFGGSGLDIAYGIQHTDDDKVLVVGESTSGDGDVSANKGFNDYWVVQIK